MESRPTTPVSDDCPVCLDPLRSGYARVNWCARHGLCRECAERIYSGGDHRCPLCRVPWFPGRNDDPVNHHALDYYQAHIRAIDPTNVVMTMQDVYAALTTSVRARVAEALATNDDDALEDMTWAPEGDAPSDDDDDDDPSDDDDDDDPYVRQWNADNADDVPSYVRTYGVSF